MEPGASHANPQMLHRFLGIGVSSMAAIFVGLSFAGIVPLLEGAEDLTAVLAYAFISVAVLLVLVALAFLKPRVPQRTAGQSVQQYWATVAIASRALLVWFVLEAGALLAAIAFLLTGHPATAVAMAGAIAAFWLTGPDTFARP